MQANFFNDSKAEAMAKEGLGDRCPWFAKEAVLKPRDSLVASPGYAFVSADYSQVMIVVVCSSVLLFFVLVCFLFLVSCFLFLVSCSCACACRSCASWLVWLSSHLLLSALDGSISNPNYLFVDTSFGSHKITYIVVPSRG